MTSKIIKTKTPFGAALLSLITEHHPKALSGDPKETASVFDEMTSVMGGIIAMVTVYHGKRVGYVLTEMTTLDILVGVKATLDMHGEEFNSSERIWSDIENIGPKKPLGYLPIVTLDKYCSKTPLDVQRYAAERGLQCRIFSEGECRVGSGAVYVWHAPSLDALLDENQDTLVKNGWPLDADAFAARVARDHADDPALYRLIGLAFADWRFAEGAAPAPEQRPAAPQGEPLGGDGFGVP